MTNSRRIPGAAALAVLALLVGCGKVQPERVLEPTPAVTLESRGSHAHGIDLGHEQFVTGVIEQISVDVVVTIVGPDGETVRFIDRTGRGPERVGFESTVAGTYKIIVSPFEEQTGDYSLGAFHQEAIATDPARKVDQLMTWYDGESPGGVVAVAREGELSFSASYGLANVEYGIPNSVATPWHMASVSKQFTAFAIVLLHQAGELDIEDDVRNHLPDLPDFGHTITLRHLLNHTSGLRDHWNLWAMSGGRMDDVIRQEDLYRLVLRQRELNFEPGSEYFYSNTGYLLLSEVVSAVTEEPFGEWMAANIFLPLGMDSTQIYDDHERIVPGRAYSYYLENDGFRKSVLSYANSGATTLFTTAEDLAKWLDNFRTGQIGGSEASELLSVQGILNDETVLDYALGISVSEHNGLRRLSHGGGDAGFRTWLAYYPDIDAGIIVLGNAASFAAGQIGAQTAEAFFAVDMQTGSAASPQEATESTGAEIPADLGNAIAGQFVIDDDPLTYVDFIFEDGQLSMQFDEQSRFAMLLVGDAEFALDMPGRDVSVAFDVAADGTVMTATLIQEDASPIRRAEDWEPDSAELTAYSGRYYSHELETFYEIALGNSELTISQRRHGTHPLVAQERDVFESDQWYIGTVAFQRDDNNDVSGLTMSNGRVRNLVFKKVTWAARAGDPGGVSAVSRD